MILKRLRRGALSALLTLALACSPIQGFAGLGNLGPSCPGKGPLCAPLDSVIKSVQQVAIAIGVSSLTGTATITSVDTTKAFVIFQGATSTVAVSNNWSNAAARVALTNATTVTATVGAQNGTNSVVVNATVIEFASHVNSIQQGTISLTTAQATNTGAISAVGANAFIIYNGNSTTTASGFTQSFAGVQITSSILVTAQGGLATAARVVAYTVVDLDSAVIASVEQRAFSTSSNAATSFTDTFSTSVTPGNTILAWGGQADTIGDSAKFAAWTVQLATATTGTLAVFASSTDPRTVYYTVVQFQPAIIAVATQRGTIGLTSVTSATATLSNPVTTTKAFVNFLGFRGNNNNSNVTLADLALTNSTTVTAAINTSTASTQTVAYEVVQWQ